MTAPAANLALSLFGVGLLVGFCCGWVAGRSTGGKA